jgi:hypothetical protein
MSRPFSELCYNYDRHILVRFKNIDNTGDNLNSMHRIDFYISFGGLSVAMGLHEHAYRATTGSNTQCFEKSCFNHFR